MAWWQKKLLRYALSRTGFLDDSSIDLDNLDVAFGKQNVFQFKDVGLNIKRISKLAQLPPSLRIETARVLSLRLTVPADIYQSSIVAEVDGIELSLRLEEQKKGHSRTQLRRPRSPASTRSPQHRKMHRRLTSPPPYDPGGLESSDEHLPTTEEMAKSFLMDEPARERRELEASVAAQAKGMEESIASESSSSESNEYGTGATVGVPGFLAGFLQGIIDRLQVKVKNVNAWVKTEVSGHGALPLPVTLRLHLAEVEIGSVSSTGVTAPGSDSSTDTARRRTTFNHISISLLSDAQVLSELSELPSRSSPAASRHQTSANSQASSQPDLSVPLASSTDHDPQAGSEHAPQPAFLHASQASIATADSDRFADAGDDPMQQPVMQQDPELEIQPGDDNISWGSRRSKSQAPLEDLWNSMASEDDLPDSLLLDRARTPRPPSTRSGSPSVDRKSRDESPFSRQVQSPGSWPRLEKSREWPSSRQSPGSWPNLEHSHRDVFQSMDAKATADAERQAMHASGSNVSPQGSNFSEAKPTEEDAPPEDLVESRVYTHEEAESMFMSAMSHREMHIPGGWGSDTVSQASSPTSERKPATSETQPPQSPAMNNEEALAYGEYHSGPSAARSGHATPRAQSPLIRVRSPAGGQATRSESERLIVRVDRISIMLPSTSHDTEAMFEPSRSDARTTHDGFAPPSIPGTFSAYSETSFSRRSMASSRTRFSELETPKFATKEPSDQINAISVEFGTLSCHIDVPCARLLHRVCMQAIAVFPPAQSEEPQKPVDLQPHGHSTRDLDVRVLAVNLTFREELATSSPEDALNRLVAFEIRNVSVVSSHSDTDIGIGHFQILLGDKSLLSFDKSRQMSSSVVLSESTPDIGLQVSTRETTSRRSIKDIGLQTMPVDLVLDLIVFDEGFSSFGGLSGILEAGNSMLSESGITSSPASPQAVKGVRFEGAPSPSKSGTEIKFSGRINGINAVLQGERCSLQLRTTTLKALYREHISAMTFEHVSISGPHLCEAEPSARVQPIAIDLSSARLEYVPSPNERDLDRLLSLLTPSKDSYDGEDEILIDTLLSQRRKGAVLRINVADMKAAVSDSYSLEAVQQLTNELSKLSAVAKYLPEDERPGLLSLIRLKACEMRLPVNHGFGKAHVLLTDLHCAHVGLPALLALSVGEVRATQNGQSPIAHKLLPTEHLPMVMIRTLGDEIEPLVKVKLYNLCAEYSVPLLLDATGMGLETAREEVVAELTKSIAELALPQKARIPVQLTDETGSPSRSKKTRVELLVHNSAIGLQPQKLSSKGLFVISDGLLSTSVPPEQTVAAQLQLRKAAVFLADEVRTDNTEDGPLPRGTPANTATGARLTAALSRQGFVSVASIMSANIGVKAVEPTGGDGRSIEVDVKNELLLLETCADSTQTLIAVLNGLAPPSPPNKQKQYLTEPMTIEDMMASFSGEPQVKEDQAPETLFDAEAEPDDGDDASSDMPGFDDEDGLLADSEMAGSLYGPVSGMLGGLDQADDDHGSEAFPETAESLLEDDPFEMAEAPDDTRMGDATLVKELNKQCKPSISDRSVDLGLYEIEDLGFDALGGGQQPLGDQHRFNTPVARRKNVMSQAESGLPFLLHLRELHIIWNIYDGYDWKRTREGITQAVEQVEQKAEERKAQRRQSYNDREEEESVIEDFLFNSIYIGVPNSNDAQELRRQINRGIDEFASESESIAVSGQSRTTTAYSASGRPLRPRQRRRLKLERSRAHKVAFELKGVSADVLVFPPDHADAVSSIDVRVRDFEIFDNVPTSTWRKFLTHLESDPKEREMAKPMMHIEMLNVKTLEQYAASEIILHVAVQPIRLHVDQDALDFITRFFEFKDQSVAESSSPGERPFLQRVDVDTVDMCLDYKPKRVDYGGLRSGHYTEFKNFIILDGANIQLKRALLYGIKGFEGLHPALNDVWLSDIKSTQLPTILAGLAPVRSLVNIGSGVRDVVAIPVREYKKDGRIVRSIQKGAMHFGKTTTSELARLGAKVAMGTQTFLTGAEGVLSPGAASPRAGSGRQISSEHDAATSDDDGAERRAISAYANQPLGIFAGLRSARRQLELDLLTAKDALIAVQGEMMESPTPGSAAAAVARHAPTVILRPVIGASRAVGTTLLGVGNQIDRDNMRKIEDKYKRR